MTQEFCAVPFLNYLPVDYTLLGRDKNTPNSPLQLQLPQLTCQPQADGRDIRNAPAVPCLGNTLPGTSRVAPVLLRQTYSSLLQSSGWPASSVSPQTCNFPSFRSEDAIPLAQKRRRLSPSRDSETHFSDVYGSGGANLQGRRGQAWPGSPPAALQGAQPFQQLPLPAVVPGGVWRSAAQHASERVFLAPLPRPMTFSAGRGQNQTPRCSSRSDGQASAPQQERTAAFDPNFALGKTQTSRLPHAAIPVGQPTQLAFPLPSSLGAKSGPQAYGRPDAPQIPKAERFTQLASLHLLGQLAGSGSAWNSDRHVTISALKVQQKRLLLERYRALAKLQQLSKAYCEEEVGSQDQSDVSRLQSQEC